MSDNKTINSLWISGDLKPINHLTVRSFKEHGHDFTIWSFDRTIKADCTIRDAREFMNESEVFYYKKMEEAFKFGGIAEKLKALLLYKVGGWHVDLDVTCLKPFDFEAPYVFRPHKLGIVGNIIKAPKESNFAGYYVNNVSMINAEEDDFENSVAQLSHTYQYMNLVYGVGKEFTVNPETFGLDEDEEIVPLFKNCQRHPPAEQYAIHWCGAMEWYKNYEPGSYYDSLLKKYALC